MSNTATRRATQILKAVGKAAQGWGKAQKIWNTRATPEEKRKLLTQYCHLSTIQIRLALPLTWEALNLHIKKSLKRYFLTKPETDPLYPVAAMKRRKV